MGPRAGSRPLAPDFASGADLLLSLANEPAPAPREPAAAPEQIAEVRVLSRKHEKLAEEATQGAFASWPAIRDSDAAMRATRKDLAATLRVLAAATLVADPAIVTDDVQWFEAVLTGHAPPLAFVPSAFDLLAGVLPAELAHSRETIRSGKDACSEPGHGTEYFS